MVLEFLKSPITALTVPSKERRLLSQWGVELVVQLILHLPRAYKDRSVVRPLAQWREGEVNTEIEVVAHRYFPTKRGRALKIIVTDHSSSASLLCFGRNALSYVLKVGARFRLAGPFQQRAAELYSSLFECEPVEERRSRFNRIVPLYTLPKGLQQRAYLDVVEQALTLVQEDRALADSALPPQRTGEFSPLALPEALTEVHLPTSVARAELARRSLAFFELVQLQVTMQRIRASHQREPNPPSTPSTTPALSNTTTSTLSNPSSFLRVVIDELPFDLTSGQLEALQEIAEEIQRDHPMRRLLQGDVGAGKTLVALLAALPVVESGAQVAFMVPTELLAHQHYATIGRMCQSVAVRVALLTGTISESERLAVLAELEGGAVRLVIGTHALFSAEVRFRALKLVIIDEQQRFGVKQRVTLMQKGRSPHLLMMTATPIPRTLALSQLSGFGLSEIHTLPKNRLKVETHLATQTNESRVFAWVARELHKGHQAYVVCPLIDSSEHLALRDVSAMHRVLSEHYLTQWNIACIHSQMEEQHKDDIMRQFSEGAIDVLVATSVVEVGINVPNATCMVIDHAERFGLSTLHQLRGRVGRASFQSYAFLIYNDTTPLTPIASERLKLLLREHDGFNIAEADLLLRGAGDFSGTRQSGFRSTQIARFPEDFSLLPPARTFAHTIYSTDPTLSHPSHHWLQRPLWSAHQQ